MPVLVRHPASACEAVRAIRTEVHREGANLKLRYVVEGKLDLVRFPRSGEVPLWRHTCCEIFVRAEGEGYREFNFSPSGDWAAYAFRAYRDGGPLEDPSLDPGIVVRRAEDRLELEATVPAGGGRAIGLSAVIEEAGGRLSYWALRHPAAQPDFHHPQAFALELP